MTRGYLFAAAAVVLIVNASAIGSVLSNRSGDAVATVVLTERELALPPFDPENTGLFLEVKWQAPARRLAPADAAAAARRDRAALEAVGFDCSLPLADENVRSHYRRLLGRTGFVVFEYDGEAWRAYADAVSRGALDASVGNRPSGASFLDSAERLRQLRLAGSRLIPVDAGADATALRRRYPGTSTHLIVPGVIRLEVVDPSGGAPARFALRVEQAWPAAVHVPAEHRAIVEQLARSGRVTARTEPPDAGLPRYEVTVAYGSRHEPWITGIRRLPVTVIAPVR